MITNDLRYNKCCVKTKNHWVDDRINFYILDFWWTLAKIFDDVFALSVYFGDLFISVCCVAVWRINFIIIVRWHIGAWSVQLAVHLAPTDVSSGVVRRSAIWSRPVLRQGRRRTAVERCHRDLEALHRSRHARPKHRCWCQGEAQLLLCLYWWCKSWET